MIEQILSPFDWVLSLPIETQFRIAAIGSLTGFLFAAIVRESTKDKAMRMAARAVGLGAFVAMLCYASYATNEVKVLSSELMVKRGQDATQIADQSSFVAVASEYTTTVGNQSFSVVRFSGGRERPMSITARREDRIGAAGSGNVCGVRGCIDIRRRTGDSVDDVRNGTESAIDF